MNKLFSTVLSLALMCFTAACSGNSEAADTLPPSTTSATAVRKSENNTETVKTDTDLPSAKEEKTLSIEITVGDRTFSAALYDNETAEKFAETLPLTLDMSELNGNEKYFYLSDDLPTAPKRPDKINSGDIMLYGSSCLVLFYDSFSTSYSYTPIGCIDDPDGLAEALGKGGVTVTFKSAE